MKHKTLMISLAAGGASLLAFSAVAVVGSSALRPSNVGQAAAQPSPTETPTSAAIVIAPAPTPTPLGDAHASGAAVPPTSAMAPVIDAVGSESAAAATTKATPPPPPLPTNAIKPSSPIGQFAAETLPEIGVGDNGDAAKIVQDRLIQLGFRPGGNEGVFGWTTYQAVLAFQKMEGLERTGDVDRATWLRLRQPVGYRPPIIGSHVRVDVDLDRQVMFIANAHGAGTQVVLNTSTGGGYEYVNPDTKNIETAETPIGSFAVYNKVDALEKAPLGTLYRPQYFVGGYAIHGSPSVPGYPASHGCLRVSNPDMDWLWDRLALGSPVALYEALTPGPFLERRQAELAASFEARKEDIATDLTGV